MIPFISLNDLGDRVGEDVSASDLAVIAIDAACEAVRSYIDNPINLVEDEVIRVDGSGTYRLVLPRPPVREVSAVTELATDTTDDVVLVAETDFVLERYGILRRVDQNWFAGYGNVEITYTHGWDIDEPPLWERVPADMRLVALNLSARIYASGTKSIEAGGVAEESIGSGDYQYRQNITTLTAATRYGLNQDEIALLNHYRTPHIAPIRVSSPEAAS